LYKHGVLGFWGTDQIALLAYLSFLGFYLKMKKQAMARKR
jgi:hypothetical protein